MKFKSTQFWLRLLPVIGLFSYNCVCFQLYSNDLLKVPRINYQDTKPYYNTEESEIDVVNERQEMSREEDTVTQPAEHTTTPGLVDNRQATTFSLLNSRVEIPDQSELDQVDEEALKNGHSEIEVDKNDETVTEVVQDDDGPKSLPLTSSMAAESPTRTSVERVLPKNVSTQYPHVVRTFDYKNPNPKLKSVANSFHDTISKIILLKNTFSHLKTSRNGATAQINNTFNQTLSDKNLSSELNTSNHESLKENQRPPVGSALKPDETLNGKGEIVLSDVNYNSNYTVNNASNLDAVLNKKLEVKSSLDTNTTHSSSYPKVASHTNNPLIEKLDKKLDNIQKDTEQGKGPLSAGQTNKLPTVSASSSNGPSMTSFDVPASTAIISKVTSSKKASQDRNSHIEKLDEKLAKVQNENQQGKRPLRGGQVVENMAGSPTLSAANNTSKETLQTIVNVPASEAGLAVEGKPGDNHKFAVQQLDKKLHTILKDKGEKNMSPMAFPNPSTFSRPTAINRDNAMGNQVSPDSTNVKPSAKHLKSDNPDVKSDSKVSATSKPGPVSLPKNSLSEEERDMESYGLQEMKGTGPPKKRSTFRRMDIFHKPFLKAFRLAQNKSTSTPSKTAQRLTSFLKTVKQMLKEPETADNIMEWEKWSPCSRTCGKRAFRSRQRKCGRLVKSDFDVACPEPIVETQKCREVSCAGQSSREKLKDFLKMNEEDDAKVSQHPGGEDDQKMIDQMFGKSLDHPRVYLGANAVEKPLALGDEEKNQDESTVDNRNEVTSDYQDDNDDESENKEIESVQSQAPGTKRYLYTVWGSWSACTRTCGQRSYKFRKRYCINAVDGEIKRHCQMPTILAKKCQVNPCPVDGGLSPWSDWSSCSGDCGVMERHRRCTNPKPAYGGKDCDKLPVQVRLCGSCKGNKVAAVQKLGSYSPKRLCGFDPCQRVGCLEDKNAICVTDFECNPTFFDEWGDLLRRCKDDSNLFLRPLAQKRCSFNPCKFTKCDQGETKCLVDTNCRPFFVNREGKKVKCKGANVLHISSELICGFNPCKIATCTVDPDAKCVTDYRCNPLFVNSAGKIIRGCTEDEAAEAERVTQSPSNEVKETTASPTVRDHTALENQLYLKLKDSVEKYREEQSTKKSMGIEGKMDQKKNNLETIELLENVLKRRLKENSVNSEKSVKNPSHELKNDTENGSKSSVGKSSKERQKVGPHKTVVHFTGNSSMERTNGSVRTLMNLSGKSVFVTTEHENNTETTEVVEQASSRNGGDEPHVEHNIKGISTQAINGLGLRSENVPTHSAAWTDGISHVQSYSNHSPSNSSTLRNDSESAKDEQAGSIEKVDSFIIDEFNKKKKLENSGADFAKLSVNGGYSAVSNMTSLGSGELTSVNNDSYSINSSTNNSNDNTYPSYNNDSGSRHDSNTSSLLTILVDQHNESSSAVTPGNYKLGIPLGKLMDSRNNSGHSGNDSPGNEASYQSSSSDSDKASGDSAIKTDGPYVYPWENYLADLANENGTPVSYDDATTDSVASGQSVNASDFQDLDEDFRDFDIKELADSEQSEKTKSAWGDRNKEPGTFTSAGTHLQRTDEKAKQKESGVKTPNDLNVQIPLYDMNEASNALAQVASSESQGVPSKEKFKGILTSADTGTVSQKTGSGNPNPNPNSNTGTSTVKPLRKPPSFQDGSSQNKLPGAEHHPMESSEEGKAPEQKPLVQHTNVTSNEQSIQLIKEKISKAIENELSKMKLQDLLRHESFSLQNAKDEEKQGSEGVAENEEDNVGQSETSPNVPVFNDKDDEESDDDKEDLNEIDDFLRQQDSRIGNSDQESNNQEYKDKNSDVFDKNEGTIESPNDYKVSLVPGEGQRNVDTEENKEQSRIIENSSDMGAHHEKARYGEPEFKDSYSPALSDEIKELGLDEYYIKDGYEQREPKHKKVEDGELRHVTGTKGKYRLPELHNGDGVDLGHKGTLPVKLRKTHHMSTRLLPVSGDQAFLRKHNSNGDEIERRPSDSRIDDVVERSRTLKRNKGNAVRPSDLGDTTVVFNSETPDNRVGSLAKYLNNLGKYIGNMDGKLLSRELAAKERGEASEESRSADNALVLNARNDDDSDDSSEVGENAIIEELASRKDRVLNKGSDNDEFDKDGIITLTASEDHQPRHLQSKKDRIKKNLQPSKRYEIRKIN